MSANQNSPIMSSAYRAKGFIRDFPALQSNAAMAGNERLSARKLLAYFGMDALVEMVEAIHKARGDEEGKYPKEFNETFHDFLVQQLGLNIAKSTPKDLRINFLDIPQYKKGEHNEESPPVEDIPEAPEDVMFDPPAMLDNHVAAAKLNRPGVKFAVDPDTGETYMSVRAADGKVYTGVAAIIE